MSRNYSAKGLPPLALTSAVDRCGVILRRLCFLVLLTLCTDSVRGATYFVDSRQGDDARPGTSASSPWRSLAKINSASLFPGDRIFLKRGSLWREQLTFHSSGAEDRPILLDAYGDGPLPIITGADLIPSSSWSPCDSCPSSVSQANLATQPNIIIFDGVRGNHKSSQLQLASPLDWSWSSGRLYIFSTGSPSGVSNNTAVEAGARPSAVVFTGQSYITIQNIEADAANAAPYTIGGGIWAISPDVQGPAPHHININHTVVRNCAGDGIHLESVHDAVIDSNLVSYNENIGIQLYGGLEAFPISAVRVTNNEVHHNRYIGIGTFGCPGGTSCRGSSPPPNQLQVSGVSISGNKTYANGAGIYLHHTVRSLVSANISYANDDTSRKGEGYCVGLSGSSDNVVEKNECYGATHAGIELSIDTSKPPVGSSNNLIRYNLVHDNGTYGLMTDAAPSSGNTFSYNVIFNHRNGSCIFANNTGHRFLNNTCLNNVNGIYLYVSKSTPRTGEITIKNNIIVNSSRSHIVLDAGVQGPITLDNNAYFPDDSAKFRRDSSSSDFASWRSQTGQDIHSEVADPRFVSAKPSTFADFSLRSDSPLVGRAADLGRAAEDALDPDSPTPSTAHTSKQEPHRWDVGAVRHKP